MKNGVSDYIIETASGSLYKIYSEKIGNSYVCYFIDKKNIKWAIISFIKLKSKNINDIANEIPKSWGTSLYVKDNTPSGWGYYKENSTEFLERVEEYIIQQLNVGRVRGYSAFCIPLGDINNLIKNPLSTLERIRDLLKKRDYYITTPIVQFYVSIDFHRSNR